MPSLLDNFNEAGQAPAAKPTGSLLDSFEDKAQDVAPAPQEADPIGAYRARHANDTVGQKLKSIVFGDSDNPTVEGIAPMAIPAAGAVAATQRAGKIGSQITAGIGESSPVAAAPQSLSKLANYLGGSAVKRVGTGAAAGAAEGAARNPQDRASGAITGGLTGLGAGIGGEALGSALQAVSRPIKTAKMAMNPADMNKMAGDAIEDATKRLKSSEATNLAEQLKGKQVSLDTTRIRGIDPEIDSILASKANPYGEIPSEAAFDATEANKIRQILDSNVSYKKLGPHARSAEVAASDEGLKSNADRIRGQLHDISPGVSETYDQWAENLSAARSLDKGSQTNPVNVLTSPSKQGLNQSVDRAVGTDLRGLGSQLEAAKEMSSGNPLKKGWTVGSEALKGGISPLRKPNQTNTALDQLLRESLFKAQEK